MLFEDGGGDSLFPHILFPDTSLLCQGSDSLALLRECMSPAQVHVTGKYKIWNYSPTLQTPSPVIFLLLIFFFALLGFELRAYALSHSTSPFFVIVFFKIGFHNLFACLGWLQTAVLLISAS
jgi:hypothetical protein